MSLTWGDVREGDSVAYDAAGNGWALVTMTPGATVEHRMHATWGRFGLEYQARGMTIAEVVERDLFEKVTVRRT